MHTVRWDGVFVCLGKEQRVAGILQGSGHWLEKGAGRSCGAKMPC